MIEHEALHSAIAQHKSEELQKRENQFQHEWVEADLLQKTRLFYTSIWYVVGEGQNWDEERILARIQNARQSHREIQEIKKAVLS
ncbi:hypothetical protein OB919_15990 [Halobacteria archaeon AArc-curdl1]|uniref:Uncharacterized protein n=1 Tax=Natronosalvus hydrolyticus TaxID=2979988 RepID=A0AAP2ZA01_9EURY|nr:hypothetical protein [Halobacteria archaeon AArc-curdl1]